MSLRSDRQLPIDLDEATLPKLLSRNAAKFGTKKAALREKRRGIWQGVTWQTYLENVRSFSLGLAALGLIREDRVAVISANHPAALFAQLGVQAAGGISVALYQDASVEELRRALAACNARFAVVEDQEQVDKILELTESVPSLAGVIYLDKRGLRGYPQRFLHSFATVQQQGKELDGTDPGRYDRAVAAGRGDDIALICATAGTTGEPKLAMLSHRNLLSMAMNLDAADKKRESDESFSLNPFAWFGEPVFSLASPLVVGYAVNFPEKPETVPADLREIGPHVIFFPPKVWEGIAASVQARIMGTTSFNRLAYHTFMDVGKRAAELSLAGKPVPIFLRFLKLVGHICLYRALKDRLGLSRVRSALTGGSPLSGDLLVFFHAIGVNLKQLYGLTEIAGAACMHRDGEVRRESCGVPLPGTEVRIAPSGEILVKGDSVFRGYCSGEGSPLDLLDDGWRRTGDLGRLDGDGHLVVTGRLTDAVTLNDGTLYSPQRAEQKLTFSPFIKDAIVVGKNRPAPTALICIDGGVMGKWASDRKLAYASYSDLAAQDEVGDLICREVAAVNRSLPDAAAIGRFALLYKELDPDDGELTRSGMVRRGIVEERYRKIIDTLYDGSESVSVEDTIELQDGKSTRITTTVRIRTME
jgi:long-chain acyl-CoA synthetase